MVVKDWQSFTNAIWGIGVCLNVCVCVCVCVQGVSYRILSLGRRETTKFGVDVEGVYST